MNLEVATFDKNISGKNYNDVVFTVSSTTKNNIVAIKISGKNVNENNFVLDKNKLTLKKDYLNELSTGEKIFTIVMEKGNNLISKINIENTKENEE